jgi:hypothetical protein
MGGPKPVFPKRLSQDVTIRLSSTIWVGHTRVATFCDSVQDEEPQKLPKGSLITRLVGKRMGVRHVLRNDLSTSKRVDKEIAGLCSAFSHGALRHGDESGISWPNS